MQTIARAELVAAVGKPCLYCDEPMTMPTRDHIKSRASGGTLEDGNKALVCFRCNQDKGARSLISWLRALREPADERADVVARVLPK